MSTPCADCMTDIGHYEYAYMVHDHIWTQTKAGKGYLCIGCLEGRIGRRLNAHDFTHAQLNWSPYFNRSPRLQTRLEGATR